MKFKPIQFCPGEKVTLSVIRFEEKERKKDLPSLESSIQLPHVLGDEGGLGNGGRLYLDRSDPLLVVVHFLEVRLPGHCSY